MGDFEKQERVMEEEERESLLEGVAVLDFDVLCSTVALQAQHGKWGRLGVADDDQEEESGEFGVVLRMWEGEILECFDDHRIALESTCCPCYRFGKNMKRAGFGSCYIQAAIYFVLAMGAFLNCIAFIVTRRHCNLYLAVAVVVSFVAYLGFFRTRLRKKFNINGSDSSLDDCVYHFACPCCTLCQESRTLEMNNVEDGIWHGRGDKICIGGYGQKSKGFFQLNPPSIMNIDESSLETKADTNVSNPS
ncbi:protein PLANT CADMIUM RESISTANCE 7 [Vigna radiata var. radiata]|uniref:Protein PLANT CADMIUM RESISTANCE 7 n=1 Tax=Vigna radiata var. radiata TaxID=3916 RepID=A0A1S3UN61_VIGRR|nr:protein PLANT CADMIUM RESISTANCE 7 [Vigna radiata var. radiata]